MSILNRLTPAIMETADLITVMRRCAKELKARELAKPERCYIVEGSYADPQVTGDLVIAPMGDEAQAEVERVRGVGADEWTVDLVEMPIERILQNLETLERTPKQIQRGLDETLESLNGKRCRDCNRPFSAEDIDKAGRCEGCAGQDEDNEDDTNAGFHPGMRLKRI